jgi:hypothetical protein
MNYQLFQCETFKQMEQELVKLLDEKRSSGSSQKERVKEHVFGEKRED